MPETMMLEASGLISSIFKETSEAGEPHDVARSD